LRHVGHCGRDFARARIRTMNLWFIYDFT